MGEIEQQRAPCYKPLRDSIQRGIERGAVQAYLAVAQPISSNDLPEKRKMRGSGDALEQMRPRDVVGGAFPVFLIETLECIKMRKHGKR